MAYSMPQSSSSSSQAPLADVKSEATIIDGLSGVSSRTAELLVKFGLDKLRARFQKQDLKTQPPSSDPTFVDTPELQKKREKKKIKFDSLKLFLAELPDSKPKLLNDPACKLSDTMSNVDPNEPPYFEVRLMNFDRNPELKSRFKLIENPAFEALKKKKTKKRTTPGMPSSIQPQQMMAASVAVMEEERKRKTLMEQTAVEQDQQGRPKRVKREM